MQKRPGQKEPKSLSCVICAYNEAATIADVLTAVRAVPHVSEVIVVDDGSTDGTPDIARRFPEVQVLTGPVNLGKTHALATGLAFASGDYIVTLDADLIGLTAEAIICLIQPVFEGRAAVSISLRANSLALYEALGLDFVSGERVFPAALLRPHLGRMRELPRWGAEVFMNSLITQNRLAISVVRWPGVVNKRKSEKIGVWPGLLAELSMTMDIFEVLSPATVLAQNFEMLRLCKGITNALPNPPPGRHHRTPLPI